MGFIVEFFNKLHTEHLITTVIVVVLVCIIIVSTVILSQIAKSKKESKMYKDNAENAINSLTPEEIDNISQNVADKKVFYEILSNASSNSSEEDDNKKANSSKQKVEIDTKIEAETEDNKPLQNQEEGEEISKPKKKNDDTLKSSKQTTARVYTGKWKIKKLEDKFYAELTASNGGLLLKTELYATLSSLKNGIETLKKGIETGNIVITFDRDGHYRFKIFNSANRLICISESYSSKAKCEKGILSVKRFSVDASIIIEDSVEL